MKVQVVKDYKAMSEAAAKIVMELIETKPRAVLGLATGSTPLGLYRELVKAHERGLDFSKITTFNLDEYVGLPQGHPQTYRSFMEENLFVPLGLSPSQTHLPDPGEGKACENYDRLIDAAGGIDLQILGIGKNGHIAFNEPAEILNINTSRVTLTDSTIKANARFFDSEKEVPKEAVSMGMGSIFRAKKILLMASGFDKSEAVRFVMDQRGITTKLPASLLHLHPDVTLLVDEAACAMEQEKEVKVLDIPFRELREKIVAGDGSYLGREEQINHVVKECSNLPEGSYLRLREVTREGRSKYWLTLKKRKGNGQAMVREYEEISVGVQEVQPLLTIFEELGFQWETGYKSRESYEFQGAKIDLDQWDEKTYPKPYAEIEVENPERLPEIYQALGIPPEKVTLQSIRELQRDFEKKED